MGRPGQPRFAGSSLWVTVGLVLIPIAYAAFIEPLVTRNILAGAPASVAWVWLIAAVIVLEGWAWLVLARPLPGSDDTLSLWLFFLLFLRTAVEIIMFLGAYTAAGGAAKDSLAGTAFILLVLKFLVCLFAMMGSGSRPTRGRWIIAQSVAVTWSCLAYTMCWGRVLARAPTFVDRPIGAAIVDSFAAILLFLLLYGPVRVHAVLAVHRGERGAIQECLVVAGFGAITLASLWGFRAWWLDVIVTALDLH